jgi:hypothetical protein
MVQESRIVSQVNQKNRVLRVEQIVVHTGMAQTRVEKLLRQSTMFEVLQAIYSLPYNDLVNQAFLDPSAPQLIQLRTRRCIDYQSFQRTQVLPEFSEYLF